MLKVLISLAIFINILGFILMGYDKNAARKDQWRIPEKRLLFTALAGGSLGILLGMKIFRHKTRHALFSIGVPFIILAQLSLYFWLTNRYNL